MSATAAILFTSFICATSGNPEAASFQGTVASTPKGEVRKTTVVRDGARLEIKTDTVATEWNLRQDGEVLTLVDSEGKRILFFRRDHGSQMASASDGQNLYRCFLDRPYTLFTDAPQNFCDAGAAPADL